MYTTLEEAKEEVWKRWNDADLRRRVMAYVEELPEGFGQEPWAVLARHLGTPNFEFCAFMKIAKKAELKPLCPEFIGDKICSKNPDKLFLGKNIFCHDSKGNGNGATIHNIIDFCTEDGKPFHKVKTRWGEGLVAYHHRKLSSELPVIQLTDITAWLKSMGGRPELFYHRLIALFVCHGIMFENFLDEGDEGKFTRKIVRPAIRKVTEHFGLKPLIVRLRPEESEADPYWCWYPGHLEAEVKKLMEGSSVGLVAKQDGRKTCLIGADSASL
jgi:hypothetical protein